jgi:uncharacterized protein
MDRRDMVLAALYPGGDHRYSPVQVQKFLFLIDRQIAVLVGGPHFDFRPYHYGPFDRNVYVELDRLADAGLVDVHEDGSIRTYALTARGQREAETAFGSIGDRGVQDYLRRTSEFVRTQSFSALVSSIYKAFPDMRVNSVFQG